MMRVRGWRLCAVLAVTMGTGFAQVSSKSANDSGVPTVAAREGPKEMTSAELTATIKRLDAESFVAYNNCGFEKFGSFFPEHLEFYHDQTGGDPMTREQLVAAIKQNICGKVHREVVSIEVFPMNNYGALETGYTDSAIRVSTQIKVTQNSRNCAIRGWTLVDDGGDQ